MGKQSFKFYCNQKCEYFPCHSGVKDKSAFNCMFCFCPLYEMKSQCGGNYTYLSNGIKDCSNCLIPHSEKGYDYIMKKLEESRIRKKIGGKEDEDLDRSACA